MSTIKKQKAHRKIKKKDRKTVILPRSTVTTAPPSPVFSTSPTPLSPQQGMDHPSAAPSSSRPRGVQFSSVVRRPTSNSTHARRGTPHPPRYHGHPIMNHSPPPQSLELHDYNAMNHGSPPILSPPPPISTAPTPTPYCLSVSLLCGSMVSPSILITLPPKEKKQSSVAKFTRSVIEHHLVGNKKKVTICYGDGYTSTFNFFSKEEEEEEETIHMSLSFLTGEAKTTVCAPSSLLVEHLEYTQQRATGTNMQAMEIVITCNGPKWTTFTPNLSSSSSEDDDDSEEDEMHSQRRKRKVLQQHSKRKKRRKVKVEKKHRLWHVWYKNGSEEQNWILEQMKLIATTVDLQGLQGIKDVVSVGSHRRILEEEEEEVSMNKVQTSTTESQIEEPSATREKKMDATALKKTDKSKTVISKTISDVADTPTPP
eukprot:6892612-Ditylum_brightwellii.AAC.1